MQRPLSPYAQIRTYTHTYIRCRAASRSGSARTHLYAHARLAEPPRTLQDAAARIHASPLPARIDRRDLSSRPRVGVRSARATPRLLPISGCSFALSVFLSAARGPRSPRAARSLRIQRTSMLLRHLDCAARSRSRPMGRHSDRGWARDMIATLNQTALAPPADTEDGLLLVLTTALMAIVPRSARVTTSRTRWQGPLLSCAG